MLLKNNLIVSCILLFSVFLHADDTSTPSWSPGTVVEITFKNRNVLPAVYMGTEMDPLTKKNISIFVFDKPKLDNVNLKSQDINLPSNGKIPLAENSQIESVLLPTTRSDNAASTSQSGSSEGVQNTRQGILQPQKNQGTTDSKNSTNVDGSPNTEGSNNPRGPRYGSDEFTQDGISVAGSAILGAGMAVFTEAQRKDMEELYKLIQENKISVDEYNQKRKNILQKGGRNIRELIAKKGALDHHNVRTSPGHPNNSSSSQSGSGSLAEKAPEFWRYISIKPEWTIQFEKLDKCLQFLLKRVEELFVQLDPKFAAYLLDINTLVMKAAIDFNYYSGGFTPGLSTGISFMEAVTGVDLKEGVSLSVGDRIFKMTEFILDTNGSAKDELFNHFERMFGDLKASNIIDTDTFDVSQKALSHTKGLLHSAPIKGRNGLRYDNLKIISPDVANKGFKFAPWDNKLGPIVEGTSKSNLTFVRLYSQGSSRPLGEFISNTNLDGKTIQNMVDGFSLPKVPDSLSVIEIKSGTPIRFGYASKIEGWGKGGYIQHQIVNTPNTPIGSHFNKIKLKIPIDKVLRVDGTFDIQKINSAIRK